MKKILVPVDFSPAAANAACYAVNLAYHNGAKVELLNVFQVPEIYPMEGTLVLPFEDYGDVENEAKNALGKLVDNVDRKFKNKYEESNFQPVVVGKSVCGEVDDEVRKYFMDGKMNLIIIGLNSASKLSKILVGSNARKLIAQEVPLMLIPSEYEFKKPKKVAFATDFSAGDIAVLSALAEFVKPFNTDILIMHTDNPNSNSAVGKQATKDFLNRVTDKVNYRNIYYRHINSERIEDGLDWIVENGQVDILAMVHRKHSFLHRLVKGSYTLNMSDHIQIPLLVLPPDHSIPM